MPIDPEGGPEDERYLNRGGAATPDLFWVAELVDPVTEEPFAPAVYWTGGTRPGFDPVTTRDIQEAWKYGDAATCQADLRKLAACKRGRLKPMDHAWARRGAVPQVEEAA